MNGGTPTAYTYNDADQLTSDGTSTYTYDDNGNLVSRGSDRHRRHTFTWDYASRMTGATVASTTASYTYDGEDTRVAKTVASTPTTYLWDRESGLPVLVDDGSNAYLHASGALGEISASAREDLISDALGSVRGVSDGTGALTGSADFDAYGAIRASSGSTASFAFTGEQSDPETGFTYLRARYLDPAIGRFGAVDTVIPNAPGTQGYNPYGYVADNPVRWVDPSGHLYTETATQTKVLIGTGAAVGLVAISAAINLTIDIIVCYLIEPCRRIAETIRKTTNPTDWPWPWTDPGGATGGEPGGGTGGNPGPDGGNEPDPEDDPIPEPGRQPEPGGGGGGVTGPDGPGRGGRRDLVPMYRAVDEAEYVIISACACFEPSPGGGLYKYFAAEWGGAYYEGYHLYKGSTFRMVSVSVPRTVANQFEQGVVDTWVYTYFVRNDQLPLLGAGIIRLYPTVYQGAR